MGATLEEPGALASPVGGAVIDVQPGPAQPPSFLPPHSVMSALT